MLAIPAGAIYTAYEGWNAHGPIETPASLDAALILGTIFTLVVGCGLMALVFYSSRKGYDEPSQPLQRHIADDGPEAPLMPRAESGEAASALDEANKPQN
jgi:hypothetical protein